MREENERLRSEVERLRAELTECEAARDDFFDDCDSEASRAYSRSPPQAHQGTGKAGAHTGEM